MNLALVAATLLSVLPPPDAEIWGPMDGESLMVAEAHLAAAMAKGHEVTLRISSPGGDGLATLLFIDKINDAKWRQKAHVTCIGSVMVASAAAILFESPVCDVRILEPATVMMFHQVATEAGGKTSQVADLLELMKALDLGVAEMIAPRMGMTPAAYLAWIDGHDRFLSAIEAKRRGFTDRLDMPCPPPSVAPAPAPVVEAPAAPPPPPSKMERIKRYLPLVKPLAIPVGTCVALFCLLWVLVSRARRPAPVPVKARRRK